MLGAQGEQCPCQPTWPRADLDHRHVVDLAGGAGNLLRDVEIEKKVLAERFERVEPMPGDHLAQRRQSIKCGHSRALSMPFAPPSSAPRSGSSAWPCQSRED
jgi:hypothetical protein